MTSLFDPEDNIHVERDDDDDDDNDNDEDNQDNDDNNNNNNNVEEPAKKKKKVVKIVDKIIARVCKHIKETEKVQMDLVIYFEGMPFTHNALKKKYLCPQHVFPFFATWITYVILPKKLCGDADSTLPTDFPYPDMCIAYATTKMHEWYTLASSRLLAAVKPLLSKEELASKSVARTYQSKGRGVVRVPSRLDSIDKISMMGDKILIDAVIAEWGNCFHCEEYYYLYYIGINVSDAIAKEIWNKAKTKTGRLWLFFNMDYETLSPALLQRFNQSKILTHDVDEVELMHASIWSGLAFYATSNSFLSFFRDATVKHMLAQFAGTGLVRQGTYLADGVEETLDIPADIYNCILYTRNVVLNSSNHVFLLNGFADNAVFHMQRRCNLLDIDMPPNEKVLIVCPNEIIAARTNATGHYKAVSMDFLLSGQAALDIKFIIVEYAHYLILSEWIKLMCELQRRILLQPELMVTICGMCNHGVDDMDQSVYASSKHMFAYAYSKVKYTIDSSALMCRAEDMMAAHGAVTKDYISRGLCATNNTMTHTGAERTFMAYSTNATAASRLIVDTYKKDKEMILLCATDGDYRVRLPIVDELAYQNLSDRSLTLATGDMILSDTGTQMLVQEIETETVSNCRTRYPVVTISPSSQYDTWIKYRHLPSGKKERWNNESCGYIVSSSVEYCRFHRCDTVVFYAPGGIHQEWLDLADSLAMKNLIVIVGENFGAVTVETHRGILAFNLFDIVPIQ